MRKMLIGLLCAALAVAVVGVPASASTSPAHVAKKKCKKTKSAVAAKKKCKKKVPAPTTAPPTTTGPTGPATPVDTDGDGVPDSSDDCVSVSNSDQADGDADGHGDACDPCPLTANPGSAGCPAGLSSLSLDDPICVGSTDGIGTVNLTGP